MPEPEKAKTTEQLMVERYHALIEIMGAISRHNNLAELFAYLSATLKSVVAVDGTAVGLLDRQSGLIRMTFLAPGVPDPVVDVGFALPASIVPAGWVIENQKSMRLSVDDPSHQYPMHAQIMRQAGLRVSYHFPLTTSLTRLGVMIFVCKEETYLEESELKLMQLVADQVAIAVENIQNYAKAGMAQAQMERRSAQLKLLLELTNNVAANLGLKETMKAAAKGIYELVECAAAVLTLHDPAGDCLRIEAMEFPDAKFFHEGLEIPINGSMAGKVFRSGEPMVVHQMDPANYTEQMYQVVVAEGFRSQTFVPFMSRGRALGAMGIARREGPKFSEEDVEFLVHIAGQISIAIENALTYEAVRSAEQKRARERDRLRLLMDLTNLLASNLELSELLQATSASVRRLMQCDIVTIHLPAETSEGMQLRTSAMDFPDGRWVLEDNAYTPMVSTMHGDVFRSGKPLVAARLDAAKYPLEVEFMAQEGIIGGCVIPMIHRGRVLGNLGLGRREEKKFTDDEVDFLMQFGAQVAMAIENALAFGEISQLKERLAQEKLYLEDEIRSELNFEEIIGESPELIEALRHVETVAASDATVLILGETGTGKELIARAIHQASRRKRNTFIKLNCAAIPTGLLESELFGHEKGAFTGAISQKIGRLELANGGTLFLDEVGDIPLELQPKLLRALQEREFERLGSTRTQKVDVRLLAATNRDLPKMVADNEFRSDLFYRLNVFPISIPPLRERQGDIPRLVRYFVSKYAKKMDKHIESIPAAAMQKLQGWHWPGNVRELENFIERSVILTRGSALHIPAAELESATPKKTNGAPTTLRETERDHIVKVLRETRGVLAGDKGAAARLGLKRTTLQYKMKKLNITPQDY